MVLYNTNGNYIDVEPAKDCTDMALIKAYKALYQHVTSGSNICPELHIVDNGVSVAFKAEIKANFEYQLVEWFNQTFWTSSVHARLPIFSDLLVTLRAVDLLFFWFNRPVELAAASLANLFGKRKS